MNIINYERLSRNITEDAHSYANAAPFPHIVIRDFLEPDVYKAAAAAFPTPSAINDWRTADALDSQGRVAQNKKLGYSNVSRMSPELGRLLWEMNSAQFLRYLEAVTGIQHLLPDAHMHGGGLHQYLTGAILRVHADFNRFGGYELDRRLNVLLYLNEGWNNAWGGALELWDENMRECVVSVPPIGNTCVIFSTTSTSYHGMPDALACPEDVTRRSIAMYYYTNGRPEHEKNAPHSTLWQARPHEA